MDIELRSRRYEIKMEHDKIHHPQVQGWVHLHSAGFHEAYPPRQVNNLYFDTYGLDSYNDHIEGVPERRKLRFRWYGEDLRLAQGQLELKCKRERVGWKLVQPVAALLDLQACDWFDLQQAILSAIPAGQGQVFPELLLAARPLVINCYRREYYVSADSLIRLTLDYDIRAYDQWLSPRPNLTFQLPMIDPILIEFKCEVDHAPVLAEVLAEFPLRVRRHSKYVTALDSLMGR